MLKEYKVLIPIADNDGSDFRSKTFETFESLCLHCFGGFSMEKSNVIGAWKDANKVYSDECRVYLISFEDSKFNSLVWILKSINREMKQKSFYVTENSQKTMFIPQD